jgi:predicted RNA-binding Zn ribbon-like protein
VDYDTYSAEPVALAVELANLDTTDPDAVDEFLTANDPVIEGGISGASIRTAELASLAAMVRGVVEAESDGEVVTLLNALLAEYSPRPRLTDHDGSLHLHYSDSSASFIARLGATVGIALAHVLTRDGRTRLGVCAADDCQDVFVDTSRNRSRRYCSETCASRTTVSAYRARQRAANQPR